MIALYEYMEDTHLGPADFTIHDSENNEVGMGTIG